MNNKLSKGYVTQNGNYISYKTNWYAHTGKFIEGCFNELCRFLDEECVSFENTDYHIQYSENSNRRKGCLTIYVNSKDTSLPCEADAIN